MKWFSYFKAKVLANEKSLETYRMHLVIVLWDLSSNDIIIRPFDRGGFVAIMESSLITNKIME